MAKSKLKFLSFGVVGKIHSPTHHPYNKSSRPGPSWTDNGQSSPRSIEWGRSGVTYHHCPLIFIFLLAVCLSQFRPCGEGCLHPKKVSNFYLTGEGRIISLNSIYLLKKLCFFWNVLKYPLCSSTKYPYLQKDLKKKNQHHWNFQLHLIHFLGPWETQPPPSGICKIHSLE